jgi:hypothetical protein
MQPAWQAVEIKARSCPEKKRAAFFMPGTCFGLFPDGLRDSPAFSQSGKPIALGAFGGRWNFVVNASGIFS